MTDQTYAPNGAHPPVDLEARLAQLERGAPLDRLDELGPVELGERGARVPWGDDPHQSVSPIIAAGMLRLLRARNARLWAELHYEAATGDRLDLAEPGPRRRNRPAVS